MRATTRVATMALIIAWASAGCALVGRPLEPPAPQVVTVAEWGGMPSAPTAARQTVTHLTVHHQGERWLPGADVPAYLRRLQQWSRATKAWSDLPYHYIIGPDGAVYAGRSVAVAGDTNTEYKPEGHIQVMLLGNFEQQVPTVQQWDSTVSLLAHLLRSHGLPAASIGAHRHWSTQTVCPGANLMVRFDALRAAAAQKAGLT